MTFYSIKGCNKKNKRKLKNNILCFLSHKNTCAYRQVLSALMSKMKSKQPIHETNLWK